MSPSTAKLCSRAGQVAFAADAHALLLQQRLETGDGAKVETTWPSLGRMRGPQALKMRMSLMRSCAWRQ
jgi:hypothetical protein